MKRKHLTFIIVFLLSSLVFAQDDAKQHLLSGYTTREVMITMRDGVRLFTTISEPKDKSTKHPILIQRTPYTRSPLGDEWGEFLWKYERIYLEHNYILVFQDCRGKNGSEGDYEDVRPMLGNPTKKDGHIDEATDTYDTVDWLIKNCPGNNGCVGFWGTSNPGFLATEAALCCHPAVKAVSPQAPVTDWWIGDDAHHNGAFMYMDMYAFFPWFSRHKIQEPFDNSRVKLREVDPYTQYLEVGAIRNFTARIDSCPLWDQFCAHPDYDDFWQKRDATRYFKSVRPAIMVIGGEFDAEDNWGALHTYQAFLKAKKNGQDVHFVYGPWSHGAWHWGINGITKLGDICFGDTISVNAYMRDVEYPFFAYYLEGKGARPLPVRVFSTGENKWNNLAHWPLVPVSESTSFYLHADGKITNEAPTADEPSDTYTSDPRHPVPYQQNIEARRSTSYMTSDQRFASYRPDVLTYQTSVLTDTLRLAGPIEADLNVAISTTDADFVVKVIDVFPDDYKNPQETSAFMQGYQMLVRGDIIRGRYRNDRSKPEAFTPGQSTEVRFTLNDVCHTFLPGHRLMVQIQSSWFPLADRNPQQFVDIYHCSDSDFIPSQITVNHSAQHPSLVRLPVVKAQK